MLLLLSFGFTFMLFLLASLVSRYAACFLLVLGSDLSVTFGLALLVLCSFLFGCHGVLFLFGFGTKLDGMQACSLQVLAKFPKACQLMQGRIRARVASSTHWACFAFRPVLLKKELRLVWLELPSIFYKISFGTHAKAISRIS